MEKPLVLKPEAVLKPAVAPRQAEALKVALVAAVPVDMACKRSAPTSLYKPSFKPTLTRRGFFYFPLYTQTASCIKCFP